MVDALERGASRDVALGVLDRIERLGRRTCAGAAGQAAPVLLADQTACRRRARPASRPHAAAGSGAALLVIAAIGLAAVGVWGVTLPDVERVAAAKRCRARRAARGSSLEPLPLPAATESYLARSRSLFASGRLRDALRELDRVPVGDSQRAAADRLRAEIQRELLAVAAAEPRPMNEVP